MYCLRAFVLVRFACVFAVYRSEWLFVGCCLLFGMRLFVVVCCVWVVGCLLVFVVLRCWMCVAVCGCLLFLLLLLLFVVCFFVVVWGSVFVVVVCCVLVFMIYRSVFVVRCSLFLVRRLSLVVVRCLLMIISCSLL